MKVAGRKPITLLAVTIGEQSIVSNQIEGRRYKGSSEQPWEHVICAKLLPAGFDGASRACMVGAGGAHDFDP